ncbi:hypothetical protein R1sor_004201 [Riccia sorocarpa]|uniref:Uncharacterized protein n=1 Tax=Riccia sorocarpa TaxID=122646 RepID=A0ABD3H9V9_9MARC
MSQLELPTSLSIRQLVELLKLYGGLDLEEWCNKSIPGILQKLGCNLVAALAEGASNRWIYIESIYSRKGIQLKTSQHIDVLRFQYWIENTRPTHKTLQEINCWRWEGQPDKWIGWEQRTPFWRKQCETEVEDLTTSKNWTDVHGTLNWADRWKQLWKLRIALRLKLWIWRLLRQGFFTMERASDGSSSPSTRSEYDGYLKLITSATQKIWTDRNAKVFRNQEAKTPTAIILREAREQAEAYLSQSKWDMKMQVAESTLRTLRRWEDQELHSRDRVHDSQLPQD